VNGESESRQFAADVVSRGGRVFVALPFDPDAAWGGKLRHHVAGTVDNRKIRGPLVREGDAWVLVLPPAWRRDNQLPDGPVQVVLVPEGPQVAGLDKDIAAALDASPTAKAFFESLAQFYRKAYLNWLQGAARRPEVRELRLTEFISLLEAGKKSRKD
jgi:hypothetical protein